MKIEEKENCQKSIDKKSDIYYTILTRKDIARFTYEDYLRCIEKRTKQKNNTLNEDSKNYEIVKGQEINHEHDKTYRMLLSNKEDAAHIINEALKLENKDKVVAKELEKYNTSFVTSGFKNRQADIVYKIKDRNIFFLIEHQSKVDSSMSYRIEEYKLEIIHSAIDMKKVKTKGYEIPTVIPIVIYTGKGKWRARLYLNEVKDKRFRNIDLLKYNLIDINQYEEKELLNSKHFIDKMFLIEKTKDRQEFADILEKIILRTKDEKSRKQLSTIIRIIVKGKPGEEKVNELIRKMKGEDEEMLAVVEMLRQDEKRIREEGIKEGVKEGISNIIINMLQKGMKVDEIKELTGLTKKEIEQVNKTMKYKAIPKL